MGQPWRAWKRHAQAQQLQSSKPEWYPGREWEPADVRTVSKETLIEWYNLIWQWWQDKVRLHWWHGTGTHSLTCLNNIYVASANKAFDMPNNAVRWCK